ncbi:DUF512 domain-containing protein [Sulfidibacter corallicola]|uniref:DUF512 domain-containing protein n=1 Tax=Sulfidibacter corallicola TaxID=2818388 RepID=A0A8A4TE42_SULCO|nr:DUF512 domain-containing protein [Sulfidibacter corallicola]QTD48216.1 DUF512 domain-containing protein [Sulfidibacter corallicola]
MARIAGTTHRRKGGVIIKSVAPESLAEACGLEPGDKIYSINGHVIPDSLSFSFNIAMPELYIVVEKANGDRWDLEVESDADASFGVALEEDDIMLCRNKCVFCFVDQNPKGYRRSLLIKDEDIRLSFMYGNYSTLSSTDKEEEDRIIREKIDPLYVSVHATDPEVRVFMLKSKKQGNILPRLKRFADNGISFHAQVVLCPEVNDGPILAKTLNELAELYPRCLSIAVVPLGITSHREKLTVLKPVSDDYCRNTIDFCQEFRDRFERELGDPLVYLGDEFYLRAGRPIPAKPDYRDFPQMENGIGMVRRFVDSLAEEMAAYRIPADTKGTLVTGTLFGPVLQQCMDRLNAHFGTSIQVAAIRNDSFGPTLITVAGLVHGRDTIMQLRGKDLGDFVVLPHVMMKDPHQDPILIDNYYPKHLAAMLKVPIVGTGNTAVELLDVLSDWKSHVLAWTPKPGEKVKLPGTPAPLPTAV